MEIRKHRVGTNTEYFIVDTHKTFWIYVDTMADEPVRTWAMNLGAYEIKEQTEESSFLDILLLTGISDELLIELSDQLVFGIIVSFRKGNIYQKQSVFDKIIGDLEA